MEGRSGEEKAMAWWSNEHEATGKEGQKCTMCCCYMTVSRLVFYMCCEFSFSSLGPLLDPFLLHLFLNLVYTSSSRSVYVIIFYLIT